MHSGANDKHWRRRASPLARQGLAWWIALVVYGSLYPLSGWKTIGIGPFAYLRAPVPQWLTLFDLFTNVLGYVPLGVLVVLSVYPRFRGYRAAGVALLTGALLSGTMEAIQTYLPTRIASNLDLVTNSLGALIGAVLTVPFTSALLDRGSLRRIRFEWFERHAGKVLALLLLWPFAQMYPQPFLLGIGDWPSRLWALTDPLVKQPVLDVLSLIPGLLDLPGYLASLADSAVWESVITALGVFGGGLLASLPMRVSAPRIRLVLTLLIAMLLIKAGVNALQTGGDSFDWLTRGACAGLVGGTLLMLLALRLSHTARAALTLAALLLSLLLINLLPLNPYWAGVQQGWRAGQYRHLNDLAQWLASVWPYVALAWLFGSAEQALLSRRAERARRKAPEERAIRANPPVDADRSPPSL